MSTFTLPSLDQILKSENIDDEFEFLKQMENMIIQFYDSSIKTEILNDKFILLKELSKIDLENDLNFISIYKKINIDMLNNIFHFNKEILNNLEHIIFTGSIIRSIFINNEVNYNCTKEIFINVVDIDPSTLIDKEYKETEISYCKNINSTTSICIMKKKFNSYSEAVLRNPILKRIGLFNDKIYCSYSFIIDYFRNLDLINSKLVEPIFSTPLDIFDVFSFNTNKTQYNNIYEIIAQKDHEIFLKNKKLFKNGVKDGLTPIEYAIDKYIGTSCDIVRLDLEKILHDLSKYNYKRHPIFYYKLKKLEHENEELFDTLVKNNSTTEYENISNFQLNVKRVNIESIEDINMLYLEYYISNDMCVEFYNYLDYIQLLHNNKIADTNVLNLIIKYKPDNIILYGIKKTYFQERHIYKIILLTEKLDYFDLMIDKFKLEFALNYIDDIIKYNLVKSMYFLYTIDKNIIKIHDEDDLNFLHKIQTLDKNLLNSSKGKNNSHEEMIKLLIKLDDTLLYKKNKEGQNPLLYHIKLNNLEIFEYMISLIEEDSILFESTDISNNTILHYLCKKDSYTITKKMLQNKTFLLNLDKENNKNMTPIMISAQYKQEELIYLLQSVNANMNKYDIFGNTVYHYICLNSLCIGSFIVNTENNFYYKPSDYNKISHKYYMWI